MKSGFIGIIGRPNVGKSTLLNEILGEKIAITADKPQTTRNKIRGILTTEDENGDDVQLIFIDTPGIHKPRTKLGGVMTDMAIATLKEVDALIFLVDGERGAEDQYIVELLKYAKTPKILGINKIDKLAPDRFKRIFEDYDSLDLFDKIYGISAISGKNVDQLIETIISYAKEGPMYFPKEMITDHPERFLVSELIREKALHYLEEEVPHGVAVEIESYDEKDTIINIGAVIFCEKKSHKGIIIGKNGRKLKGIGKSARIEIEGLLGTKVYLELFVKVKEDWRNSKYSISEFGYRKE